MEVGSGCELTRAERGDECWRERVIEHRRKEPSLNDAHGVQELLGRAESHFDCAGIRIDSDQLPAEGDGGWRRDGMAGHDIPERPLSHHAFGCYHMSGTVASARFIDPDPDPA